MTQRKKVWMAVAAILLLSLLTYGGVSLVSKMNKVDELNGKIAEAEGPEEPSSQPSPSEPSDSTDEPSEQPPDTTNASSSQKPHTGEETLPDNPGTTPGNTVTSPETTPKPSSPGDNGEAGSKPVTPPSNPSPNDKAKEKKEIDAATTTAMEKLRASCSTTSNNLVNQIVQELKADENASLESLQGDFLTDIIAAEAKCDVQFNLLMGQAKEQYKAAGIDEQSLPDWSSEYESAKSQARASALTAITKAMK